MGRQAGAGRHGLAGTTRQARAGNGASLGDARNEMGWMGWHGAADAHPCKSTVLPGRPSGVQVPREGMGRASSQGLASPLLCLPPPADRPPCPRQSRRSGRPARCRPMGWDGRAWLDGAQPSGLPCPFLLWPERHRGAIDRDATGMLRASMPLTRPSRGRGEGGPARPTLAVAYMARHGIHGMAWHGTVRGLPAWLCKRMDPSSPAARMQREGGRRYGYDIPCLPF